MTVTNKATYKIPIHAFAGTALKEGTGSIKTARAVKIMHAEAICTTVSAIGSIFLLKFPTKRTCKAHPKASSKESASPKLKLMPGVNAITRSPAVVRKAPAVAIKEGIFL